MTLTTSDAIAFVRTIAHNTVRPGAAT